MRHLLFYIFLLPALTFGQPNVITKHYLYGIPKGTGGGNTLIVRDIYALSNDPHTKFASWVAYRVIKDNIGKGEGRKWRADPWLDPKETLEPADYNGAPEALKIDRGHQAPLGSFSGTKDAAETNYLSNITPQSSELNQGPWVKIENAERKLAQTGTVYVLTGPVYARQMKELPKADERHNIPSGYWKIIYVQSTNDFCYNPEGVACFVAFIFDQSTKRHEPPLNHVVSVDSIESVSGLDFFWQLPDAVEDRIESSSNTQFAKELLR